LISQNIEEQNLYTHCDLDYIWQRLSGDRSASRSRLKLGFNQHDTLPSPSYFVQRDIYVQPVSLLFKKSRKSSRTNNILWTDGKKTSNWIALVNH